MASFSGYMPPKYAMHGRFSRKSSGVIVLEIVSGKKIQEFSDSEYNHNLLGRHVGLLCVQQRPEDRPDMSSVVLMLNGEKLLPNPKIPGFYENLK
ncbi:G-type lectin S-receptor-like serine/threonine-protein kinase SD1-1, partial [Mucuna pruriens]